MKNLMLAAVLALVPVAVAAADMEISGGFLRASPKVANAGAGFLTIKNNGPDDTLVAAEADISRTVELHTHIMEGDVMRMRQVPSIAVPAGATVALKPGGDHVMFIKLKKPLVEGDTVRVALVFAKSGKKLVEMPVLGVGAMAPKP
ncbi:MAG: copper chaperone PCu(A)C [Rhodospirillaceae bacterium]|nr:copper chaperone PCu(A)C [Rhodospirillales bacterium]